MTTSQGSWSSRLVDGLARRLPSVSRRDVLVGSALAGSALVTDPKAYALRPVTAYATVCGPGNTAASGWTVFCATIQKGENSCPPGSFAAGWWKAAGSSWCGGRYRYIVDCNAKCTKCSTGCSDGICDNKCWNCSCGTGSSATCDQRRICCNAFRYGQCNTDVACSGGVHCRVVSCTPPYEWENCTTTSLRDDRTSEHSTSLLPQWGPIASRYFAMGEQKSHLGHSLGPVRAIGDGKGSSVRFSSGGRIYQTKGSSTAYAVRDEVVRAMIRTGSVTGELGYPIGHEHHSSSGGLTQHFEKGAISGKSLSTLYAVYGASWIVWDRRGRVGGELGYPTANRKTVSNGWIQHFGKGAISQRDGEVAYAVTGVYATAWRAVDAEEGVLGLPTRMASDTTRGGYQAFEGGQLWRLGTGSPKRVTGAVLEAWRAEGGRNGKYGYPLSDTTQRSDGRWECRFEGGTLIA